MPSQSPLRILQINKAYYPHIGGIESVVRAMSAALAQRSDADVQVLVCQKKGKRHRANIDGVPIYYAATFGTFASCPLSLDFFSAYRKLSKWAQVTVFHMPFPLGDAACLLNKRRGGVVLYWHSDVVRQKFLLHFYAPLLRRFLARADRVLVATPAHIASSPFLSAPGVREKCVVVPYGIRVFDYLAIPPSQILRKRQRDPKNLRMLFVGRFVYYKGVEVLLKAFGQVHGCELFLIGEGTKDMEDSLHRLAQDSGQGHLVHFLRSMPETQLRGAYQDCDIFVLPSTANSEAFGLVQLEAMVYGKPVVNTALPTGVPEVSLHEKTGLTVPPGDPKALANAIQRLADNPALRQQYGKAAAQRVKEFFSEEKVTEQICRILRDVYHERMQKPRG